MSEALKDGPVLFYNKGGMLYPVALDQESQQILEITCRLFSPLTIVADRPQGKAINLLERPDVSTINEHDKKLAAVIAETPGVGD
ncbi:hypothetical protein [Paenibacillus gorillae]|uniref:hypothetical protein n=1 Tax=Paenibacillus gorillae TaxID=1243662 RepID=UPI0005A9266E|nr:hypothetical protein [Paenibacillus gorillae]